MRTLPPFVIRHSDYVIHALPCPAAFCSAPRQARSLFAPARWTSKTSGLAASTRLEGPAQRFAPPCFSRGAAEPISAPKLQYSTTIAPPRKRRSPRFQPSDAQRRRAERRPYCTYESCLLPGVQMVGGDHEEPDSGGGEAAAARLCDRRFERSAGSTGPVRTRSRTCATTAQAVRGRVRAHANSTPKRPIPATTTRLPGPGNGSSTTPIATIAKPTTKIPTRQVCPAMARHSNARRLATGRRVVVEGEALAKKDMIGRCTVLENKLNAHDVEV